MSTEDTCSAVRSYKDTYGTTYPPQTRLSAQLNQVNQLKNINFSTGVPLMAQTTPSTGVADNLKAMKMTNSGILNALRKVREPIVDYQETRGVSRNESISFLTLLTSLCTHAYTAAITILVMLWNLAPLLDGFVYFARFLLDKLIDIFETQDSKERVIKASIFCGEVVVVTFLLFMIMGLIFMPVYVLTARIMSKIWGMIAW